MLKDFEKKYGVDIRLSTFNDADEALTKIASEDLEFDLYFPSYDSLGRLIQADLLRPLNHDYLPNAANLWPGFRDPWYDRGSRYTVPYTIYSTGHRLADRHGPRRHRRPATTPTTCFWDTAYARQHGDPRRLAHRDGDGAAAQRQSTTSTAPTPTTSRWSASSCSSCATRCSRR